MTATSFEDALRARLHAELDPRLPDINAERRVLNSIAIDGARPGIAESIGRSLRPGLGGALLAVLVVLLVGGALTASLLLTRHAAPGSLPAPAAVPPAPVVHSPAAVIRSCDGDGLTARVVDRSGGAGPATGDIALTNTSGVTCTIDGYVSVAALVNGQVTHLGGADLAAGTILDHAHSPLPAARTVELAPGYSAFLAFEVSDVPGPGQTSCPAPSALLITPPLGHRYAVLSSWSIPLCPDRGVALWIAVAPVSSTPSFGAGG